MRRLAWEQKYHALRSRVKLAIEGWEQSETRILPMPLNMGSYTCSKYIPEEYIPAIGEYLDAEVGEWESYILKLL